MKQTMPYDYACVGEPDVTHSPVKKEEFKNAVEALGVERFVFHRFDSVGHEAPAVVNNFFN